MFSEKLSYLNVNLFKFAVALIVNRVLRKLD